MKKLQLPNIYKSKTEQNTLMNTQREREVTNFKLLVSPIHCVVFLFFYMARKLRE